MKNERIIEVKLDTATAQAFIRAMNEAVASKYLTITDHNGYEALMIDTVRKLCRASLVPVTDFHPWSRIT